MPADALHYHVLARELDATLSKGRIDKIIMPDKATVVLLIRANGQNHTMLITAAAQPRCYLTSQKLTASAVPPAFCLHLRKHIGGGIISSVSTMPFERILRFDINSFGDLGEPRERRLYVEVMGKYSNVVVTGGNGKITDALKHISADEGRPILPGLFFSPPPAAALLPTDTKEIEECLAGLTDSGDITAAIMKNVKGLAPSSAKEAVTLPGSAAENLLKLVNAEIKPTVYYDDKGGAKDFSFTEYKTLPGSRKYFDSISSAMDAYYTEREAGTYKSDGKAILSRTLGAAIDKQKKKLGGLMQDKENAADYESDRIIGELITANLYKIKYGDKSVTLLDWYTNEERIITLSGGSPAADAEKKFTRYRKKKRTLEHVEKQIAEAASLADYYESIAVSLENAESPEDLDELTSELEIIGVIKTQKKGQKSDTSKPRVFDVGGYVLTVGKNNLQNDRITKAAKGEDIWLHTQGIHGSHAIISTGKKEPGIEVIKKAASITAFFSKARLSENVPVDYTKIKNVKKPKGAPPGKVEYVNQKTLYVNPLPPENGGK